MHCIKFLRISRHREISPRLHKCVPFGLGCYHLKMNRHNGIKRIKLITTAISLLERLEETSWGVIPKKVALPNCR